MGNAGTRPEEVAPGVYRLHTGRGITEANVYFVRSEPAWVLIDTAWPQAAHQIKAAAWSLFGARSRPAAILLTHFHPDHSGSAGELARTWNVPIAVHPDELRFARGGYDPEYAHPLDRWVVAPLLRLVPAAKLEAERERNSLESVSVAFYPAGELPGLPDWEVIPTPGHTPGHVAYFRPADRVLITGDAVIPVNLNSVPDLLRKRRGTFGPPWLTTWNWPTAMQSMERLATLGARVVASGHGPLLRGDPAVAFTPLPIRREPVRAS